MSLSDNIENYTHFSLDHNGRVYEEIQRLKMYSEKIDNENKAGERLIKVETAIKEAYHNKRDSEIGLKHEIQEINLEWRESTLTHVNNLIEESFRLDASGNYATANFVRCEARRLFAKIMKPP